MQKTKRRAALTGGVLLMVALIASGCASNPGMVKDAARDGGAETTDKEEAMRQGDAALQAGNMDLALFHYVKVLNADPKNAEALYRIAAIHSTKGNLALAEQAYLDLLQKDAGHPGALEGLGLVLLRKKEYAAAAEKLAAAVEADPKRWRAHNGLGILADLRKDYASAAGHYTAALQIRPDMPMLLNNYGYSRYLAGDWPGARSYFEKAVNKDPKYQQAWSNLALLYVRQDKFDHALRAFRQVMNEPEALNSIGYVCMMSGKTQQAEEYFLKAIKAAPSYYASAHDNLDRVRTEAREYP